MSHPSAKTQKSDRPRLAVFKFASCDGCQLQLLSCEDELMLLSEKLDIVHFLEASSRIEPGPYDIAIVEGSITTPEDMQRILHVRQQSKFLMTIGACATSGGVQALKNWGDRSDFLRCVYAEPGYIQTLATSTAIADHVKVDFELRGCPINRLQLLEVIRSLLQGRRPKPPSHAVCLDCKLSGTVCIAVTNNCACLGPITQSGCGAICPKYCRGCYGCFGPVAQANCDSLADWYVDQRIAPHQLVSLMRNFNANAPEFRRTGDRIDPSTNPGELL
jgi:sulfhydrogenase subunit delta